MVESKYLSGKEIDRIKELVKDADVDGIVKMIDDVIQVAYDEMPNCEDCDERMGEPMRNEGYD